MGKMGKEEKAGENLSLKKVILFSAIFFLLLGAGVFSLIFYIEVSNYDNRREEITASQQDVTELEKEILLGRINRMGTDILYIRDMVERTGVGTEGLSRLQQDWISFSDNIGLFDQIRLIDENGNERIRVNYYAKGSKAVAAGKLQNKADRYYFQEGFGLDQNAIYVSRLDLNTVHDQIEKPNKPMIRFVIPCVDQDGRKMGVVVLNYLAQDMMDALGKVSLPNGGSCYLLNENGYWLYNSADHTLEWGFTSKDTEKNSFAEQFPNEWRSVCNAETGNFTTKNGFFSFVTVNPQESYLSASKGYSISQGEGNWHIVTRISPMDSNGSYMLSGRWIIAGKVLGMIAPFLIIMWIAAILMACLYAYYVQKKQKIRYQSQFDEMTGTYNRRYGLERLKNYCRGDRKNQLVVCFLDINGLKEVNDSMGHGAGDSLITQTVSCIRKGIRQKDELVRLGGDEFLIIARESGLPEMEQTWQNIVTAYEKINTEGKFSFRISVSHGIAVFEDGDNDDTLVERADQLMYEEKKRMKAQR